MTAEQLAKIENLVRPLIEAQGCTLYDVEFQGRILRITIDREGGIGINDCAEASRSLNPLLDVEDVIPGGRYELEVSSPGLNRFLRKPEHYTKAVGLDMTVTTSEPLVTWNGLMDPSFEKRKNIRGILSDFDGTSLKLKDGEREIKIPLEAVTKAQIEFELRPTPKKGKKD